MWINTMITRCILPTLLTLFSLSTHAMCHLNRLSIEPLSVPSNYDVFSASKIALVQTYRLKADITGEECQFDLKIGTRNRANFLANEHRNMLRFEWHSKIGYQRANQWDMTLTTEKPEATIQLKYPSNQWMKAGTFIGELEVSLKSNDVATSTLLTSEEVKVVVPPSTKIQFYGLSQRHYELDLGELSSNKSIDMGPKLWVESNTHYRVSVESMNLGALRHQSQEKRWDINYRMYLNNKNIDINNAIAFWDGIYSESGRSIPIKFVVGDTQNKPAGIYRDELQISIEPHITNQH